jgi:hypothetical protein
MGALEALLHIQTLELRRMSFQTPFHINQEMRV